MKPDKMGDPEFNELALRLRGQIRQEEVVGPSGKLTYFYSLVQKKNKTFGSKQRLLVLFGTDVAYLSELPRTRPIAPKLEGQKQRHSFANLYSLKKVTDSQIQLQFKFKAKDSKQIQTDTWGLVFSSPKLCYQWHEKFRKAQGIQSEPSSASKSPSKSPSKTQVKQRVQGDKKLIKSQIAKRVEQSPQSKKVKPPLQPSDKKSAKKTPKQQVEKKTPPSELKPKLQSKGSPQAATAFPQTNQKLKLPVSTGVAGSSAGQAQQAKSVISHLIEKNKKVEGTMLLDKLKEGSVKRQAPEPSQAIPSKVVIPSSKAIPKDQPPISPQGKGTQMSIPKAQQADVISKPQGKQIVSPKEQGTKPTKQEEVRNELYKFAKGEMNARSEIGRRVQPKKQIDFEPSSFPEDPGASYYPQGDSPKSQAVARGLSRFVHDRIFASGQLITEEERARLLSQNKLEQERNHLFQKRLQEEKARRAEKDRADRFQLQLKKKKQEQEARRSEVSLVAPSAQLSSKQFNFKLFKAIQTCASQNSYDSSKLLLNAVHQFRVASQSLFRQVVHDLSLPKASRKFKAQTEQGYITVLSDFMKVSVAFHTEKKIRVAEGEQIVCSELAVKRLESIFRSRNALAQATLRVVFQRPQFKLRVPICCLVEYAGFVGLIEALPQIQKEQPAPASLDYLALQCNLTIQSLRRAFTTGHCQSLNPKLYSAIDQSEGGRPLPRSFQLIVLRSQNVMPADLNFKKNESLERTLRPEFVRGYSQQLSNRFGLQTNDLASKKQERQLLDACEGLKDQVVQRFARSLAQDEDPVLSSGQLSKKMHTYGLSLLYLGKVAASTKNQHIRSLLLTVAASRAAKKIMRKSLQEELMQYWGKNRMAPSTTVFEEFALQQIADFVGLLLDRSREGDAFWSILSRQVEFDFGVTVPRQQVPAPFFLLCLAQELNFQLNFKLIEGLREMQIQRQHFVGLRVRSKNFNFVQSLPLTQRLKSDLGLDELISLLGSKKIIQVPPYLAQIQDQLKIALAKHRPQELESGAPSLALVKQWLLQLEHRFKADRRESSLLFNQLIKKAAFWWGKQNLGLGLIYRKMGELCEQDGDLENALILYQNEAVNSTKLLGETSPAVSRSYFRTARVLSRVKRTEEALTYSLKSLKIIEAGGNRQSKEWARVAGSSALLLVAAGRYQDAAATAKQSLRILSEGGAALQEQLVCYDSISRVYQIKDDMGSYLIMAISLFDSVKAKQVSALTFLKQALAIAMYPVFRQAKQSTDSTRLLTAMLGWLSDRIFAGRRSTLLLREATEHILLLNSYRNVVETLFGMVGEAGPLMDQLMQRKVFNWYEGFLGTGRRGSSERVVAFLELCECVLLVTGQNYLLGILAQ